MVISCSSMALLSVFSISTESWRSIFDCESFKKMLIEVAFDEAHCITQWYVAIICNLLIKLKVNVAFYS